MRHKWGEKCNERYDQKCSPPAQHPTQKEFGTLLSEKTMI